MKTPNKVNGLQLVSTCVGCGLHQWDKYMKGTTKADGKRIRTHIKHHLPELFDDLGLDYYNPYEAQSRKKKGLLVYVHSGIEYFIKYY
jgi:hypothetical protein